MKYLNHIDLYLNENLANEQFKKPSESLGNQKLVLVNRGSATFLKTVADKALAEKPFSDLDEDSV